MWYLIALFFFLVLPFPPFGVVVVFFVTFVDVLANDDVDLALDGVALGLVWAGVVDGGDTGVTAAVAGFLVGSTFYLFINRMK